MNSGIIKSVLPTSVKTSGKKKEANWSERFLLKVYIVVSCMLLFLIVFSTVELTRLLCTLHVASCAHYKGLVCPILELGSCVWDTKSWLFKIKV